jgi:microcystin-dependent protein
VIANGTKGASASPAGKVPGHASGATVYADASDGAQLKHTTITATGGNQPHDNLQPYLALSYCISMAGVYPTHP